ncbi:MAG: iron-containing redox enzyme family protein [Nostoc sp. ZfuVER08]|jgi:pyrroloquinoline-quinone synthase|uniref:Iron-containing redox enzyme family protein n=1 Tax=Nostoc punctiforme FACHB-252 TaxID=1357509 RepID=A0ABR8HFX6_NOSPU|nr:iron-containing redox enzyme family protein [Nostoc punctiforme]MBD2614393.1 iron-containing redox enzyme family protein [Nostoc punctiforme FACHB-252]MBL1202371.1 iron-containing redox enzyme family protein [Nostoc sp. GBBB01]MDZ8013555.1 iron-containing redox enzyme family protein [Nostoc sp. ZfuVER08]
MATILSSDPQISKQLHQILLEVTTAQDLSLHPFVQRFAKGEFSQDAIRQFAMKMLPGSNRFNMAFLKVASKMDSYYARTIMLENAFTEHGQLKPDLAHVALFMRFMKGIDCPKIDVNANDGAFLIPALRFKKFEFCDDEPVVRSLGRFAAIEQVLPAIFTKYIEGLRKIFKGIDDHTIEYFHIHCHLDPEHTDELIQVTQLYIKSDKDIELFRDGVQDMVKSIADMFSWMDENLEKEALALRS